MLTLNHLTPNHHKQPNQKRLTGVSRAIGLALLGLSAASANAGDVAKHLLDKGHQAAGHICGADQNSQDWRQLQKDNAKALSDKSSVANQLLKQVAEQQADLKVAGNGVAGRYYIPVVVHVYGARFNCSGTGGMCLSDAEIIDGLNKTNEDFLGLNTQDGPIAAQFQAIRENLNIEFVLAQKDPSGNVTNGIVRHGEKSGYGNGDGYDSQIAADAWDNFKYMNIYLMQDLYADGGTTNSGVAWYPQLSMSQAGLSRVVYNGDYMSANTSENFRSVFTHEFGHWLNLPHTFDGDSCSVHQEAFCAVSGDNVCDTPQMSSSILQDNTPNCVGEPTNTENFMHYSDNYAMYTQGQVARMTAALHGPARSSLWSNSNLIATGLEEYTSNADHPWDGSGGDTPPTGTVIASWDNLSAAKGDADNYMVDIPQGTEAVAFYLDGFTEDPDLYVSKGQAPSKNGADWVADYISFRSTSTPELIALTGPSSSETYHATVDAFTSYSNARLQVLGMEDPSLCNGCERVFALDETGLASAKGAAQKTYSVQVPADATKTIVVMPGGYQGDPDLYVSVNATPTTQVADCKPFSAPRFSEYCDMGAGGGTINIMIDPFLEYSEASVQVYYERPTSTSGTAPTADANGPYSAQLPNAVSFSSAGSTDSDGNIVSYSWSFGDGNASTQANPTHTYSAAGNYTATLTVTDNDGLAGSSTAAVSITDQGGPQYCIATGSTGYEWIANVSSGSFSFNSDKEGYANNTAQVIDVIEGANSFTFTPGGNYTEHWAAWVDLNNDGNFDTSEKVLTSLSGQGAVTGNVNIPAGTQGNQYRMRVVMKYGSEAASACGSIGDGEVEDYTISVVADNGNGGGGTGNSNVPDACATQSPVTSGRLEDNTPVCLGSASTIWLSMADVDAHSSVAITTAHGTGNLDVYYKNGGWPSESDNQASSTNADNSECIYLTGGTDYWSYLKLSGSATGATIVMDFDSAACR